MTQTATMAGTDAHRMNPVAAACARPLTMTDVLHVPLRRRLVIQTINGAAGPELHLFHGHHQIVFDEIRMFGFGRELSARDRFTAGEALSWVEKGSWEEIGTMLSDLLDAGFLQRLDTSDPVEPEPTDRDQASPLPAARLDHPRFWTEDADAIFHDLAGSAIEIGHLEQVIPVFRVAHPALDADGRQIGEANVFPRALRLNRPGRWLTCLYSGTRYRVDRPMNATALQAMRQHWPQMMASLLEIRRAFVARFPEARTGLTLGLMEQLCVLVLAVPTWQLLKPEGRIGNGDLHPALSSLFRVTDGLRMAAHQMLFVPVGEPMIPPETPVTVAMVHDYAERNYSFHSETGVCAGPRLMVEEFLKVVIEGHEPASASRAAIDGDLRRALNEIDNAFDYGLRGLRVFAATFTIWPAMAACCQDLAAVGQQAGPDLDPAIAKGLSGLADLVMTTSHLGQADWRRRRLSVFSAIHAACGQALGLGHAIPLAPDIAPVDPGDPLVAQLAQALGGDRIGTRTATGLALALARFIRHVQSVLTLSTIDQDAINGMTGRPGPVRPFGLRELDAYNRLQDANRPRLPFLFDALEEMLGLSVSIFADDVILSPPGQTRLDRHGAVQTRVA